MDASAAVTCLSLCSKMPPFLSIYLNPQAPCLASEVHLIDGAVSDHLRILVSGVPGHSVVFFLVFSTLLHTFCVFETCLYFATVFHG